MVLLSGLSTGLVNDGVSGLKSMPVSSFAFDEGTKADNAFSRSIVDDEQIAAWEKHPDVATASPMGASIMNAETDQGLQIDLSLFGIEPDSFLAPELSAGSALGAPGGIIISETLRGESLELGSVITLDQVGTELEVIGFTDGQATFGHVDVAYLPLGTWQLIAAGEAPAGSAPTAEQLAALDFEYASGVAIEAVDGSPLAKADADALAAGDSAAGTTSMTLEQSFNASPGYQAETLTLSMIQWFLYAIGALVVGAFFTVWTIQRGHELAVLRAMGASESLVPRSTRPESFSWTSQPPPWTARGVRTSSNCSPSSATRSRSRASW